jgi:hypothetical protein
LVVGTCNRLSLNCLESHVAASVDDLNIDDHVVDLEVPELVLAESLVGDSRHIERGSPRRHIDGLLSASLWVKRAGVELLNSCLA